MSDPWTRSWRSSRSRDNQEHSNHLLALPAVVMMMFFIIMMFLMRIKPGVPCEPLSVL